MTVHCYSLLIVSPKHIAEGQAGSSGKIPAHQFPGQWQGSFADPQNAADDNIKGVPKIICYYGALKKKTSTEIDTISSLCTHVILPGTRLENNELTLLVDRSGSMTADIASMHEKGLKVLITISEWPNWGDKKSEPSKFSLLVRNRQHREKFIQSVMHCIDSYNFDGFEIDWRYPNWQAVFNRVETNDRVDFVSLIEELSRKIKEKGLLLSSTGASWDGFLNGYDIPKLVQYLDWITLLTFDYGWSSDIRTSTFSSLYEAPINGKGSTNNTVYSWASGNNTYINKLVITVPSFGAILTLKNANRNGIGEEIITGGEKQADYTKVCRLILNDQWTYVQDPNLRVGPYAYFDNKWVSFNDPAMAEEKGRYAKNLGLGGVAVNRVEGDDRHNACGCGPYPLLRAINIGIGRLSDSMEGCRFSYKSLTSKLENVNETSSSTTKSNNTMLAVIVILVILVLLLLFILMLVRKQRRNAKKMKPMLFFGSRRVTGNVAKIETGFEVRKDESDRNRMWALSAIETGWRNCEKLDSEWEVPRSKIKMFEILGAGFFGQVWKCSLKDFKKNGETIAAVKTLKEVASDNNRHELLAEIEVMKRLGSHPHVVSFLGCCTDRDPIMILLEYVPGGKLQTYLRKSRGNQQYNNMHGASSLTSTDLLTFGSHAARGMEYLSSKGIVHRDLAARNILIDDITKTCKVADFGLARDLEYGLVYEKKSDGKIPVRWLPPESLYDNIFTTKSDVWSFGVLLWEIVALGSTPYPGLSANEVMKRVLRGYRLEKPEYCEDELYEIMHWCWKKNPEERPSFSEIVQSLENLLECGLEYINLKELKDICQFTDVAENSDEKV